MTTPDISLNESFRLYQELSKEANKILQELDNLPRHETTEPNQNEVRAGFITRTIQLSDEVSYLKDYGNLPSNYIPLLRDLEKNIVTIAIGAKK